jgi:NADH:ubiquinone oxidoreductase subunit 2 (subunit N)
MGDFLSSYMYIITYILSSLLIFSILTNLNLNNNKIIYLSDLRYLISQKDFSLERYLLVIGFSSLAGLPPFAGFYGKMYV